MANQPWELAFGPAAEKFLDSLKPGKVRRQIVEKIKTLASNPFPQGCKKLHGVSSDNASVYRERSGDYRILYVVKTIPERIVIILDVDHRKEIYR